MQANFGGVVKNITFSADENWIEAGRQRTQTENTALHEQFRLWLETYARRKQLATEAANAMETLQGKLRVGRKFTREEMNERRKFPGHECLHIPALEGTDSRKAKIAKDLIQTGISEGHMLYQLSNSAGMSQCDFQKGTNSPEHG